ncbi:glycoside hydrolase family 3 N-terminal domain-containing protein [Roseitranquillus sediminis]|uniref:glycoside hydrolase family 3 N-terminal domain-containing protein n=1 Tax=Roseitranquillus sediminis TaxID=2809051 RepID=UPI001D0C26E4|nr:glycoside hydrolase family 3 N-terminal domain-containing protein [Roseitranquillus sediminis]MBM9595003.1 glycoside hydrolase family 3 protein [Roseitranquillus sediminis]
MRDRTAAIFGCAGPRLTTDEVAFFGEVRPWGFILFDRNLRQAEQVRGLCADLRDAAGADVPILIDQEGGRVARLRPPLGRDWPPPFDHAEAAGADAAKAIRARYRDIATELRALGIDVNCVPCADVARPDTHPFLRNRCFGEDPARVARLARAAADGTLEGGVLPVIKHIPGHGAGRVDSHEALPTVEADLETLRAVDFVPFVALADQLMAMTAHVVYPAIDAERPATTSPAAIEVIRREIGFGGLLMTDDISMGALGGAMSDRVRDSLDAGCDMILHCNGNSDEMMEVAEAAGTLRGAAAKRAERVMAHRAGAPVGE